METVPEHEGPTILCFACCCMCYRCLGIGHKSRLASVYFQIWHLKLAGLLPSLVACSGCGGALSLGGEAYRQIDCPWIFLPGMAGEGQGVGIAGGRPGIGRSGGEESPCRSWQAGESQKRPFRRSMQSLRRWFSPGSSGSSIHCLCCGGNPGIGKSCGSNNCSWNC